MGKLIIFASATAFTHTSFWQLQTQFFYLLKGPGVNVSEEKVLGIIIDTPILSTESSSLSMVLSVALSRQGCALRRGIILAGAEHQRFADWTLPLVDGALRRFADWTLLLADGAHQRLTDGTLWTSGKMKLKSPL